MNKVYVLVFNPDGMPIAVYDAKEKAEDRLSELNNSDGEYTIYEISVQ